MTVRACECGVTHRDLTWREYNTVSSMLLAGEDKDSMLPAWMFTHVLMGLS